MFKGILSLRGSTRFYFYHIVYKWEDALSAALNVPIKRINPVRKIFLQKSGDERVLRNNLKEDYYIAFVMNVESIRCYVDYNVIPIVLDVFSYTADKLYNATRECEVFYVTSYGIYEYLINEFKCENVKYIPQSCPDFYLKNFESNYVKYPIGNRKIDVLQYGRRNEKLHKWMLAYVEKHPDINYLYRRGNYKKTVYISTKYGTEIKASNRNNFNQLIDSGKIIFVSARGKDEKEGEINLEFVTPRIFEAVAAGCHIIGRYSDNKEKEIFGIDHVCRIPNSYENFEEYVEFMLENASIDEKSYKEFLTRNKISVRFKEYFGF